MNKKFWIGGLIIMMMVSGLTMTGCPTTTGDGNGEVDDGYGTVDSKYWGTYSVYVDSWNQYGYDGHTDYIELSEKEMTISHSNSEASSSYRAYTTGTTLYQVYSQQGPDANIWGVFQDDQTLVRGSDIYHKVQ